MAQPLTAETQAPARIETDEAAVALHFSLAGRLTARRDALAEHPRATAIGITAGRWFRRAQPS